VSEVLWNLLMWALLIGACIFLKMGETRVVEAGDEVKRGWVYVGVAILCGFGMVVVIGLRERWFG
jgi:hypothetical protein